MQEKIKGNQENKYNAVVEIKELLIETRVKNREELENTELISINASKVLRLIYKYNELEEFYNGKVRKYKELIQDKKQYQKALEDRDKQILSYIPKEKESDEYIYKDIPLGYMEFRIKFFEMFKEPYASEIVDFFINDVIQNTKGKIYFSVFQYVDRIRCYIDSHIFPTYVFEAKKQLNMYYLFSCNDEDEFRNDIRNLYDYFYMSKYELLVSLNEVYAPLETKFYLYAVCQKILKDCLEYTYSLNLTDEEKQEQNKLIEQEKQEQEKLLKILEKKTKIKYNLEEKALKSGNKAYNLLKAPKAQEIFIELRNSKKAYKGADRNISTINNIVKKNFNTNKNLIIGKQINYSDFDFEFEI